MIHVGALKLETSQCCSLHCTLFFLLFCTSVLPHLKQGTFLFLTVKTPLVYLYIYMYIIMCHIYCCLFNVFPSVTCVVCVYSLIIFYLNTNNRLFHWEFDFYLVISFFINENRQKTSQNLLKPASKIINSISQRTLRPPEEGGREGAFTFTICPILARAVQEVVKTAYFDGQQAWTNRSAGTAAASQSQPRWAGLVSNRASEEEEVFLVAILDVRSDCLARRIVRIFRK